MSLETYNGLRCSICEQIFAGINEFRDHEDPDGVRCAGGRSDA